MANYSEKWFDLVYHVILCRRGQLGIRMCSPRASRCICRYLELCFVDSSKLELIYSLYLLNKQYKKTSKLMLLLLAFSVDRGNDELTNTTLICSLFYQYKRWVLKTFDSVTNTWNESRLHCTIREPLFVTWPLTFIINMNTCTLFKHFR